MDTKCIAIKVEKPLWKAITTAAMEEDKSLAEVVVPVLEKAFGGLVTPKVRVESKVNPNPVSETSKAIAEAPVPELKEGYGWCKACGVGQVKLPGLLCKVCSLDK